MTLNPNEVDVEPTIELSPAERARALRRLLGEVPAMAEQFRQKAGLSRTAFGYLALGDPDGIRKLEVRGQTAKTLVRLCKFIEDYQGGGK